MRTNESHAEPEWLFFLRAFVQCLDRHLRELAVMKRVVGHVRVSEGQASLAAALAGFFRSVFSLLVVFRQAVGEMAGFWRGPWHRPRRRIIQAGMIQFPHALNKIPVVLEKLGQGDHVRQRLAEVGFQIIDRGGAGRL